MVLGDSGYRSEEFDSLLDEIDEFNVFKLQEKNGFENFESIEQTYTNFGSLFHVLTQLFGMTFFILPLAIN
jgi:hypothetical protein